jgi:transposase
MPAQRKYPDELRERAVRMVLEIRARDGKGHGELARVGVSWAFTLRRCVAG